MENIQQEGRKIALDYPKTLSLMLCISKEDIQSLQYRDALHSMLNQMVRLNIIENYHQIVELYKYIMDFMYSDKQYMTLEFRGYAYGTYCEGGPEKCIISYFETDYDEVFYEYRWDQDAERRIWMLKGIIQWLWSDCKHDLESYGFWREIFSHA